MNSGPSMISLLERLYPLKRSLVSDGYDEALRNIASEFPIEVASFPSGTECWTWIVPEKWTCHEAWIETLDGRRIVDYAAHPLHVVDYSLPIDRVVSRVELLAHLHVHPRNPDAIPYVFKFYERDWGFCCTQRTRDTLLEAEYRVRIASEFSRGALKVGEWWVPGRSDRIFVLAAHLCHPGIANDDLSGVVVGLDVMKRLAALEDREYTYLLLLVPETIGSIAWLSHHEELTGRMQGGLFLEMLGLDFPHGLARSYAGDTQVDRCCEYILGRRDAAGYVRNYAEIVRNDELEFNGPLLRIPMLSLTRSLPQEHRDFPYPEYHTHLDSPAIVRAARLAESSDLAFEMALTHDRNRYARARFKGQLFCSRYGLFPKETAQQVALIKLLYEVDGLHSTIDICRKHALDFDDVDAIVRRFVDNDLIEVSTRPIGLERMAT